MRKAVLAGILAAVTPVAASGCGPTDRGNAGVDGNGNPGGDGGGDDGCSDEARFIYVVDQNNTLSRFDPPAKAFTDLGRLACPAGLGATPFSMGVDRTATAWVLYSNGELFRVDTETLACTKSTWSTQQGLAQFGMGFSTETSGGTSDTLFIVGGAGPTVPTSALHALDLTTFTPSLRGTVQGWPELTGTGSAELWGFFPDQTAPRVAKLDKSNGAALQTFPLSSLAGEPAAWAFAFYGGDFWIFLRKNLELSTTVYQMNGTTGAITGSTPASGRTIVGAGVSTCAPVIL